MIFSNPGFRRIAILFLLCILAIVAVTSYFNYASEQNRFASFPLDDAWIFWGFSKTFAQNGVLSLNPATPPGPGVTSPGFTLLLTACIRLGFTNEFTLNLILNCIFLSACVFLLFQIIRIETGYDLLAGALSALFLLHWRTALMANGGMETLFFIVFQLLVLYKLQKGHYKWAFLALGLGFWVRPELIILGPVYLLIYGRKRRFKELLKDAPFFLVPFVGYFIFLKIFTGYFWLNTGAAKYDFYSYISRWNFLKSSLLYFKRTAFPVIPVLFILSLVWGIRRSRLLQAVSLYFLLFWLAFLFYLPLLYHFGRYLFPLVPLMYIVSAYSLKQVLEKYGKAGPFGGKLVKSAIVLVIMVAGLISVIHFAEGKKRYAFECRQFLNRHVKMAYWIKDNVPEHSKVATHDVGAIGFISGSEILDLVGLLDSRAIGISRSPEKIKSYLDESGCNYVAVLNSWFAVEGGELLFETPKNARVRFQLFKYGPEVRVIRRDVYITPKK